MGIRSSEKVRRQRARVLAPLFKQMKTQRMSSRYVAARLRIPEKRFWAYMHGETRIPADFVARVCRITELPLDTIVIPEPRDRFIQQPRATKSANGGKANRKQADTTPRRERRLHLISDAPGTSAFDMPPSPRARRHVALPRGMTTESGLASVSSDL